MRVDHRAGLRPGPVHLGVHGHDLGAYPARVALGHGSVEADHGQVIGHELACPVQRGDKQGVRPDPGREVSVPGMRQHPGAHQAHRDIHYGAAERNVRPLDRFGAAIKSTATRTAAIATPGHR